MSLTVKKGLSQELKPRSEAQVSYALFRPLVYGPWENCRDVISDSARD